MEVELRTAAADERERLCQLEEQERRLRWERVRAEAEELAIQHHRNVMLFDQAERWQRLESLSNYLKELEARIKQMDGEEKSAAWQWLYWDEHN
ncbi:MAG: hypothetical protein Q7L55_03025 [Actinomycetota bacterium]|nr:hypothetical protein [Actinomycetota bacterium]